MAYRLDIEGTKISLEFDPQTKELVVRDGANPGGTFFLNEVGLAVLQYWLCMIDLDSAHRNKHTKALLHKMGLEIPDGMCSQCNVPLDDCNCLNDQPFRNAITSDDPMPEEHPPGAESIPADCGHSVIGNVHVCPRCGYQICDECSLVHNCKTFKPVARDDDEEEDDDEDDCWWNK